MSKSIRIQGAKVHNLKNLSVEIPRDQLVVFTGLSGSGKSSLAFDTIYAEGQRRYVESLSAYARQFLGQMDKPDVEFIEGLSPGDLDRPEDRVAQPALDRRHDHRDPRLPATALRAHWRAVLPQLRQADHEPDSPADRRPGAGRVPTASASWCSRRSSKDARASTARCSTSSRDRASRACASTAS